MIIEKLSRVDFSQHKLHRLENENLQTFHLKLDGTIRNNVKFTLVDGVTVITGDFGNWVACRYFNPKDDPIDSVGYFCEKLRIHSEQKTDVWSSDKLAEEVNQLINEGLEDKGLATSEIEECQEFLRDSLDFADNEIDYVSFCREYKTESFEYNWLPNGYEPNYRILVIIDAFNDIYNKLKTEQF
jgi:hypothetical protein